MYPTIIRKLENIFVFLMRYVLPVAVIVLLLLIFFHRISGFAAQEFFANS